MDFDPQHGPVERGTRGHHASAQGVDVDAEVAALDRIHARDARDVSYVTWRRREVAWWGSTVRELRALADARPARPARRADRNDPEIARAIARRTLRMQTVNVTMTIGGE